MKKIIANTHTHTHTYMHTHKCTHTNARARARTSHGGLLAGHEVGVERGGATYRLARVVDEDVQAIDVPANRGNKLLHAVRIRERERERERES
jgi:hypothetical protein